VTAIDALPLQASYTRADLASALRAVGLAQGDIVFCHVALDALGQVTGATTPEERCALVLGALRDAIGNEGTVLVPTYTFSFCKQELFDPLQTPTSGGLWSPSAEFLEYFRTLPGVVRSDDPIHSVAGLGPQAQALLADVPPTCFGAGSVFARLRELDGKICMFGLPLEEATFRHHVEEMVGVPFRFQKLFTGQWRERGALQKRGWLYYVRMLAENGYPDGGRLEQLARAEGVCRAAPIGAGELLAVPARAYYDLTARAIAEDPWLTAKGPAGDPVALDAARVGTKQFDVALRPDASMREMIDALWRLPRDIVSDGYDAALQALGTQVPMTIHEYASGTECWSWIVPEKWTCHEAYLETLDGRRLFSYADHPLHVVSYSLPFDGIVTREELFRHLHVHLRIADAIPFEFKYYERDWGLCCTREMKETLTDERYRVVIRTSFSHGTLKVGEVVVPGRSDETVMLCAHLCHPHMVNDDLTGVVVGIDVMRELRKRRDLRYSYRFTIVPETIGSVAYLSRNEALIPRLKGGFFLEMLGRDHPHALQLSYEARSEIDRCSALVLRERDAGGWITPFRTLAGNDERQYNAPGVRAPMLQVARMLRQDAPDYPYREYHSSHDTPDRVPPGRLEESRDLVLAMIDTLEANQVPVNRFKGEVFCSRYGINVDTYTNPEGHRALFDIMFLIDGTRSVAEIAEQCGISFRAARRVIDELIRHGLVGYSESRVG
jgi:aminopeptidase-like protein/aminoglycoside N3'-acetyltransferase